MLFSHFMRVQFKIVFLVVILVVSLVRPIMAMQEEDTKSFLLNRKRKRVICPKTEGSPAEVVNKENNKPEVNIIKSEQGVKPKKAKLRRNSSSRKVISSERNKEKDTGNNNTVTPLALTDLPTEILEYIFLFTISPNTEDASTSLRALTLVDRKMNSLVTAPCFLRRMIRTIPDVSLHIWMEGHDKYNLTLQMLSFVYVLKKIVGLESQGRLQETKDFYIKILGGRTPAATSPLLAY